MIDPLPLQRALADTPLAAWSRALPQRLAAIRWHGDLPRWLSALEALPRIAPVRVQLDRDAPCVTGAVPPAPAVAERIRQQLQQFHPWRKGPFLIHGIGIDSEWRSERKWARIAPHLADLSGRLILDVGCGNGYYGWRMLGAGAGRVIGIDPSQLYVAQFLAIRHFFGGHWPLHLLPFGIEMLPENLRGFDSVFSMGVLYHRRSPLDHLLALKGLLRAGGELVLETLVIEGREGEILLPPGRYAKMRNVWFIPTTATLTRWLERCGFRNLRLLDVTPTTRDEQRSTPWMRFESLPDFLHPADPQQTVEGLPAPRRALFLAESP